MVETLSDGILDRIAMDILGPLPTSNRGNKYTVAKTFVNIFVFRFGVPKQVHTDHGSNFEFELFSHICRLLNIQKTRKTHYHPQSGGMVERFNRTLINMLSKTIKESTHWEEHLNGMLFDYNTTAHTSTKISPFEIMFKREARLPIDYSLRFYTPSKNFDKTEIAKLLDYVKSNTQKSQNHQAV
ncbi:Retrovirus-related Pol polyprotein [Thelohanellus kitauei]|uniref:Retrovirus-related Pol polyprotein n=1 Tax=Thelohanellus kitauei TaxID=669202 RepID=A0A0C2MXE6_THEKT|nr:Retrovirus-related Pol polyprotein [Thelohanellus kitauei]